MDEKIYGAGRLAYRKDPENVNNPYTFGTPEYDDFERGWVQQLKRSEMRSDYQSRQSDWKSSTLADTDEKKRAAQAYSKATGG